MRRDAGDKLRFARPVTVPGKTVLKTLEHKGSRSRVARVVWLAVMPFVLCAFAPSPSRASDFGLLSVGIRARFSQDQVLGQRQPESFREYDLVFTARLPWEEPLGSGWELGARLMASLGTLRGEADLTAPVASVVPLLALATQDGRFALDLGLGLAVLGKSAFARQDFGGTLQFALTLGFSVPLYERVGLGYRFMHYSDGRAYGSEAIGVDFHMVELIYRF